MTQITANPVDLKPAPQVKAVPKEFDTPKVLLPWTYTYGFGNAQLQILYAEAKDPSTGLKTKRFGLEFKDQVRPRPHYVVEINEGIKAGQEGKMFNSYYGASISPQSEVGKLHFDAEKTIVRSDDYRGNFSVILGKDIHPIETLLETASALNTCYLLQAKETNTAPDVEVLLLMNSMINTARTPIDSRRQSPGRISEILRTV